MLHVNHRGRKRVYIGNPERFDANFADFKLRGHCQVTPPQGGTSDGVSNTAPALDFFEEQAAGVYPAALVIRALDTLKPECYWYGCNAAKDGSTIAHHSVNPQNRTSARLDYNRWNHFINADYYEEYMVKAIIVTIKINFVSDQFDDLLSDKIISGLVVKAWDVGCPYTSNLGKYTDQTLAGTAWNLAGTALSGVVGPAGSMIKQILYPAGPNTAAEFSTQMLENRTGFIEDKAMFTKKSSTLRKGVEWKVKIPVQRMLRRFKARRTDNTQPFHLHSDGYDPALPSISLMHLMWPMNDRKRNDNTLRTTYDIKFSALVVGHHNQVSEIAVLETGYTNETTGTQTQYAHQMDQEHQ